MTQNKIVNTVTNKPVRFVVVLLAVFISVWGFSPLSFPLGLGALAQASNVSSFSDTLSTSAPNTAANHTIKFTTPTGITAGQTIKLTFPAGFTLTGVVFGDLDLSVAGVEQTLAATASGATWGAAVSGQDITFTSGTGTAAAGAVIIIKIGTNAVTGGVGTHRITNHATPASYPILLAGTMADSGRTYIAIVNTVVMTASIDTSFTFTISGVAAGQASANGETISTTTISTTPTTIPWGSLTADVPKVARQDLSVVTNAQNGFTVTLQQDQPMTSGTGAIINNFKDGASTTPPTAWTSPLGTLGTPATYGHFGITSESTTGADEFGVAKYAGNINSPRTVFSNTSPSDGTTPDKGATKIGFKIEVTSLQSAGSDYSNTLTYVATPVY